MKQDAVATMADLRDRQEGKPNPVGPSVSDIEFIGATPGNGPVSRIKLPAQSAVSARAAPACGTVPIRHFGPGGCENGGGIGRFIGYVAAAAQVRGGDHLVTDTRGPHWSFLTSPWRLALSMAVIARDRVMTPARLHHIHLAGRGSTVRKLMLAATAWRLGAPYILHLHDYDYSQDFLRRRPLQQSAIRRMFQRAAAVIVLSQRDRRLALDSLGVDPARLHLFHNSVPDPGEQVSGRDGPPMILFLGRLSARKGVPELLEALSSTSMRHLEWRAVLAGDGPVEDYWLQADRRGIADRVEMPGWLSAAETAALCRQASILVLPSHAEGLAMALLEGLAHGIAVVTTRVGAHEEAIIHGQTGLFVPVGDAAALATALADLIDQRELREGLARRGRNLFLERFCMGPYMDRLDDLYFAVATGRVDAALTEGGLV